MTASVCAFSFGSCVIPSAPIPFDAAPAARLPTPMSVSGRFSGESDVAISFAVFHALGAKFDAPFARTSFQGIV